jgi:(S)-2-hydroxyglutarate dehydrogenase
MRTVDYLIIGAGIVGITIALELKKRYPEAKVMLLDKESELGKHSSGRNSGVLHSGIYYPPRTLKAQVCRQGAIEMKEFHREHQLKLRECGKVLVVAQLQDSAQLDLLAERATQQEIAIERLDEQQLRVMEPEARSVTGRAIFVPSTAVGDPVGVMRTLNNSLVANNIELRFASRITKVDHEAREVHLQSGDAIRYGHVINTAGLNADKVAHQFGCGERYTLLPFKGIYWKLNPDSGIRFNHLVYPVPDLRVPFLGVHTTTTVDGDTYFGPTAVPAFGRENYQGLAGVSASESARITALLIKQFAQNRDGFRRLAWQEGRRSFKRWFVEAARAIVPNLRTDDLIATAKVGIRAQMFDTEEGKLVNDFLIEQGRHSTHILNAISPAWTSAFPFARHVCDHYVK